MSLIESILRRSDIYYIGEDLSSPQSASPDNLISLTDFISATQKAQNYNDIHRIGLALKKKLEFDYFGYGFYLPGLSKKPVFIHFYDWACEWSAFYREKNLYTQDPCVKHCLNNVTPYIWSSANDDADLSSEEQEVMNYARDFGRSEIISVPIHGARGTFSTIRFSQLASKPRNSADKEFTLQFMLTVATFIHEATYRIALNHSGESDESKLTQREKEILLWSSEGKDVWAISQILRISKNTVSAHLKRIYKKLDVSNRQHAVAKAINSRALYL